MASAIIYKMKKNRENEMEEELEQEELDYTHVMNEDIATNPAGVLRAHEQKVFGEDENEHKQAMDYYWYDESTTEGYPLSWEEGVFSFPMPYCWRCVCYAHVQLVRDDRFDMIVNITIGLVAVAFTLHLMDKPDLSTPSTESLAHFVVLVKFTSLFVFTGEMLVKLLAEGTRPLRYWTGPEAGINTFDSTIVILSFALMGGGGGEVVLPVLRLARLVKLLNRTQQTRRVLYGIIAGFRAMVSIVVLLSLILFLYAIIGVKSFGENDPAHFGTLPIAMLTLFVACTLSDWSRMLQTNYKGCDKGGEDWGYTRTDELTKFKTAVGHFYNWDCYDPTPRKFAAIVYFYSFPLLTAFVVLNLFISAIDMAMFDILYSDKVEEHAENTEKDDGHAPPPIAASKRLSFADPLAMQPGSAVPGQRTSVLAAAGLVPESDQSRQARKSIAENRMKMPGMRLSIITQGVGDVLGINGSFYAEQPTTGEELATLLFEGPEREHFDEALEMFFEPKVHKIESNEEEDQGTMVRIARYICQGTVFPGLVVTCILIAGLIEALSVDPEEPVKPSLLILIDTVVLAVFVVECILKIVACGRAPYRYFADSWNVFDFVIVLISVIGMVPQAESMIPGVAMLRLLRLLKLVNFYPALNVAVSSLIKASSNVFYAVVVLILVIYVYAVVGILIFRVNDPGHYGTLAQAIAAVWAVCTQDGWDVIMYVNMYGCSRHGYPFNDVECRNSRAFGWIAALYFVSLILIGAWMLPTVIIGITTIAFAESTEEIKEEYAQLKMAMEVSVKAAELFDTEVIPKEIIYPFNVMYARMAEEQVKCKMLEFNIETTKQSESNTGLRVFMMRPFMKYICANYVTGLLPPNRSRLRDDQCDELFEAACGTTIKEARCTWPCFLFLLNFMKCSAEYAPPPAEGEETDDDEGDDDNDRGHEDEVASRGHKQVKSHEAKGSKLSGKIKNAWNKVKSKTPNVEESKVPEYGMQMIEEVGGLGADGISAALDIGTGEDDDPLKNIRDEFITNQSPHSNNPDTQAQVSCGSLSPFQNEPGAKPFEFSSFFNYKNEKVGVADK